MINQFARLDCDLQRMESLVAEYAFLEHPTEFTLVIHSDGTEEIIRPEYKPSQKLAEMYKTLAEFRDYVVKVKRKYLPAWLDGEAAHL